jgi:putative oxidoreductase
MSAHPSSVTARSGWRSRIALALGWLDRFPASLLGLIIRVGIADVFWRSGQTKVDGWHVTESAVQLFRDEYKVPLLTPEFAATLAAVQEHLFSVLLIVGLASRPSALGLLGMTAVIEIFVYPEYWPEHLLWSGSLLYVIARGPGGWSIDALLCTKFGRGGTPASGREAAADRIC